MNSLRVLAWAFIAVVTTAVGCNGPGNPFTRLDDSRRLAADVRLQFNKAADASNRAVMADTDEASIAFARETDGASQAVERDVATLEPLLRQLAFKSESQTLEDFKKRFADYRALDRKILALAVENTNLKAQSLSFGPAAQAANGFRDSLATISAAASPKDRCRVDELVAKATLAVREIQVMLAPHIAEPGDAGMTRMEREMAALDASAQDAIKEISVLAHATPAVTTARSAFERFQDAVGQIVKLSRRNTNVLSLDLALREKPPLAGACDESLRVLQDALGKRELGGTR